MGMKRFAFLPLALIAASPPPSETPVPSPNEIVAAAKAEEWVAIAASDLLVMDLAADRDGKARRVVIQLMPAPFSQGWVGNIRTLATAKWWDGTSVNRVQDNYVVQWGDATEKKALPGGLSAVPEEDYATPFKMGMFKEIWGIDGRKKFPYRLYIEPITPGVEMAPSFSDTYNFDMGFAGGFPIGIETQFSDHKSAKKIQVSPETLWPVHCYGMVGVGRNMPPDTGTGAELYTVIGHAPRHLDRNIALVGRVIQGIEHLSSLPRGTGALGFYEKAEERVPILSVRLGNEVSDLPKFEYLSTESRSFAAYADARANRRDAFFIKPAGGADICNIPVPVRMVGK
jgi:cyclophilin family peptidyl-prolyl cis-trans isomerase